MTRVMTEKLWACPVDQKVARLHYSLEHSDLKISIVSAKFNSFDGLKPKNVDFEQFRLILGLKETILEKVGFEIYYVCPYLRECNLKHLLAQKRSLTYCHRVLS